MTGHSRTLALLALCLLAICARAADFMPAQLQGFPRDHASLQLQRGREALQLWIADTPERQEQGLMFLTELPPGYGMLFPQSPPRVMTMWMKNTYVSLDMLFLGADGRVLHIARNTTPLSTALISFATPVSAVLEIRAGESQRLGLREGDRLLSNALTAPTP